MTSVEVFGYRQELKRSLRLLDLVVYGLVFISPLAAISTYGMVYNLSQGLVPLVYAVGAGAMVFTAISYAMMAQEFPVAGSVYAYVGRGVGDSAGFLAGWAVLLDYALLPAAVYVVAAVAIQAILPGLPKWIWVVALLLTNTTVNIVGVEKAARANAAMLIIQIGLVAIFIVLAILALAKGVGGAHWSWRPMYSPGLDTPAVIFNALPLAAISFLGFDAISTHSEEAKDGPKTVAIATIVSLLLAALFSVVETWLASLFVLDVPRFASGDSTNTAFYEVCQRIGGPHLKLAISILGVVTACAASALVGQAGAARLIYGMARDGRLPSALSRVNPRRQIPIRAVLLVAAVTLTLGLLLVNQLELLLSVVSFGALTGFFLLHVSVIVHFAWRKRSRQWFRHLILPGIGALVIGFVLISARAPVKVVGLAWLVLGGLALGWLKFRGEAPLVHPTLSPCVPDQSSTREILTNRQ